MDSLAPQMLAFDTAPVNVMRLEQFAWLIENIEKPRMNTLRLVVLWRWAGEMAHFQSVANSTGKPVEYFQRGEVLRTLYPEKEAA